jgi:N-acyl-D-amino-acid deacylase
MRIALVSMVGLLMASTASAAPVPYDVTIRGGTVYDGSGGAGRVADVAVRGDRIVKVAPHIRGRSRTEIKARGKAVAPGFINMLAHPEESFLVDGRALSDLVQGVTLEVMGEDSMGPLSPDMKAELMRQQGDLKYPVDWTTLGEYLTGLERRGVSPNVASYVSAGTVRAHVLGQTSIQPTPEQLKTMQGLVHQAMEEGALGLTTALIYTPATFAKTPELVALASESARCGGLYAAHIRNEGDRVGEAVQETIDIAKASGGPAEIYHFKQSGRDNWGKLDSLVAQIEAARASGVRITADMYVYPRSATGLDAAVPSWVQDGGLAKWIERLKDPEIRERVANEMRDAHPRDWENTYMAAGADGVLLLGFKTAALKPYAGKTLAEVAKLRGVSPEEAAMQLVVEDGSRIEVSYASMSEDNVRKEVALPWVSFDSDASAPAPEGAFLLSSVHPRTYGAFARVLAKYVREEKVITTGEAVRKLSAFPAQVLGLKGRGALKPGYYADIVVFDPATIQDHATFAEPHQLATGVEQVLVNGQFALKDAKATGAHSGRVVRGRAWTGQAGGGCRASASDWTWKLDQP